MVHYSVGQKYDSHHDWGVSGYAESRYITLLLYLTDMPSPHAGGETVSYSSYSIDDKTAKQFKIYAMLFMYVCMYCMYEY